MENKENEAQEIEAIKKVATEFFYWWYNQKGSNTEQGFDEWAKTVDGQSALTASQNEVERLRAENENLKAENKEIYKDYKSAMQHINGKHD
jgi:hypothetical protein